MSERIKLTWAQRDLLTEMLEGPTHVAPYYEPAKKLVAMGLAEWTRETVLGITDAGRAALSQ